MMFKIAGSRTQEIYIFNIEKGGVHGRRKTKFLQELRLATSEDVTRSVLHELHNDVQDLEINQVSGEFDESRSKLARTIQCR